MTRPAPVTSLGAETLREKGRICARKGFNPNIEFYGDAVQNKYVMEGYAQEKARLEETGSAAGAPGRQGAATS